MTPTESDKAVLIWSSRDSEVALHLVFLYAKNSLLRGWWKEVTLVIWGPSAQVLSQDQSLWPEFKALQEAGVQTLACRVCADRYGVTGTLEDLGVEVIHMGQPLTHYLKRGLPVLTF